MRGLVVLCLCSTVLAAPQGYLYNQQQNGLSLGLPNFSSSSQAATATQENHGFLQQAVNSGSLSQTLLEGQTNNHNSQQFSAVPNFSALQQHAAVAGNFGGLQQQYGSSIGNFGGQQQQQSPSIASFAEQHQQQGHLLGNFGQQQHQQQQQYNELLQQQPQYQVPGTVTKDIYIHVAPEDNQDHQQKQRLQIPQAPRKHYRIVFIKAPSQNTDQAALRLQQAPTEEKTIIYVLTKKADPLDLQNAIQDIQPKQPSKPEVYFIKYKTQAEAQHAQRTIQAQYDKLGGTSQISDEGIAPVTSVVGALDNTQQLASLDLSHGFSQSSGSSSSAPSFTSSSATNNASKYLPPIGKL